MSKRKSTDDIAPEAQKRVKPEGVTDRKLVLALMLQFQKPMNANTVYENLRQRVLKPTVARILDELTEESMFLPSDFCP